MRALLLGWALAAAAQPVIIDGSLDETLWRNAATHQLGPGELRVAVAGRYLYAGARLPEPGGRVTARSMGRNPHWEEEDLLRVVAGAYPDWVVQVGPLGGYSVETKGFPVPAAGFFAAARIADDGWSAEVAIPLNDLKAARPEEIRLSVEWIRAPAPGRPQTRWRWPELGPAAPMPPPQAEAPAPVFRPPWLGNREPPLVAGGAPQLPPWSAGWGDPPWREAPEWPLLRNEPGRRRPRFPAQIKVIHDRKNLAVLARLADPNPGESFDVYLATSGSAYVQIGMNLQGKLSDSAGMSGGPRISRPRPDWESGARGVARPEGGTWTARLDIPLEAAAQALGEALAVPVEWRVLFARSRPATANDPRETSLLPITQSDTPYCPARYRRLVLAEGRGSREPEPAAAVDLRVLPAADRGMLERHARGRVRRILEAERREWDAVHSRQDWERFRDRRVEALKASLGSFPTRGPLDVRVAKEYPGQGYRRQDLAYQSRPGLWVTANLYLPGRAAGRRPAIVIVHSHHRPRTQAELQDMGILWARAGSVVLIMDQIGAGERLENYPWNREAYHSRYILGMQLHLAGESLIGWMAWDILRGVDLLVARPEVDPQRIILLGAVAGGGDPAAVAAALDPRIAAVAPFNFGECTPESPRFLPEKNRWPLELADPGWGSWETTRGLRRSIADQFFPWVICASVAPRRFVYSFEMGWNVEDLPAWARYRKVFGFYDALDNLDEAHGFGPFPGPGECTNIGPAQRATLYPELQRWFGIPPPEREPDDRRPEAELAALTPALATQLQMRPVRELVAEAARVRPRPPARLREALREKLGDIEPPPSPEAVRRWTRRLLGADAEGFILTVEPGIVVPLVLLRPSGAGPFPVTVAVSQGGKEQILADRGAEIEARLRSGSAVCLPDVRGTGETAPDSRRGPLSADISLAATELMLGNTMLGARLKDLRTVLAYLATRRDLDAGRVTLWGETPAPPNPPRLLLDELPGWQVGPEIQHQQEPLGALLALLAALYEDRVREVRTRGGLTSFFSLFDSSFAYVPADVIVPGILQVADIPDLVR